MYFASSIFFVIKSESLSLSLYLIISIGFFSFLLRRFKKFLGVLLESNIVISLLLFSKIILLICSATSLFDHSKCFDKPPSKIKPLFLFLFFTPLKLFIGPNVAIVFL